MRRSHCYADGGKVVKDHLADAEEAARKASAAAERPDSAMLGTGLAKKAADALRGTRKRVDDAEAAALGLKNGGKVIAPPLPKPDPNAPTGGSTVKEKFA